MEWAELIHDFTAAASGAMEGSALQSPGAYLQTNLSWRVILSPRDADAPCITRLHVMCILHICSICIRMQRQVIKGSTARHDYDMQKADIAPAGSGKRNTDLIVLSAGPLLI